MRFTKIDDLLTNLNNLKLKKVEQYRKEVMTPSLEIIRGNKQIIYHVHLIK